MYFFNTAQLVPDAAVRDLTRSVRRWSMYFLAVPHTYLMEIAPSNARSGLMTVTPLLFSPKTVRCHIESSSSTAIPTTVLACAVSAACPSVCTTFWKTISTGSLRKLRRRICPGSYVRYVHRRIAFGSVYRNTTFFRIRVQTPGHRGEGYSGADQANRRNDTRAQHTTPSCT